MNKNEESFKAVYHGVLAVASLAEVFTASKVYRKVLLLLAAGWHARCTFEHLRDIKKNNMPMLAISEEDNISWGFDYPVYPKKSIVFNDYGCKVTKDDLRQAVSKSEGQTEAL